MKRAWAWALILGIFGADQASKLAATAWLEPAGPKEIIPGLFNLVYVRNPGAAFGLFSSGQSALKTWFFIGVSLAAIGLLAYLLKKAGQAEVGLRASLCLIIAGALGNLTDRLRLGEVIDFLDFYAGAYHWPAFNLADAAITAGGVLLALHFLRRG